MVQYYVKINKAIIVHLNDMHLVVLVFKLSITTNIRRKNSKRKNFLLFYVKYLCSHFYDLQTIEQFKPQKLEVFQDHFLYKTIYIFASVMFHGMRWSRFLYLSQIYRLQGHQT